jgi:23S rRNA (cytosine1962-C5)-methyltransferase
MSLPVLQLKKGEDKRIQQGHVWIYSNEVDIQQTALKGFKPGEEVLVRAANHSFLGVAYVNPHSLISARLFSNNPKARLNQAFLREKLSQALALRESLFSQPYYRLAFGESDGLPGLVVDRYGEDLVVQVNTCGMENKKEDIILALQSIFPQLNSLLWRNDSTIRHQEGLDLFVGPGYGQPPETVLLEENQVQFYAPLWQGQKTGWFFDHRLNRARLQAYVRHQEVLDVFSYLGGWGIQAATYGAARVTCVDSSAFACEWTLKNAALNQVGAKVTVLCENAVTALQKLHQEKKKFDVIILDPPAFIKKRKDQKEGLLAYQRINSLALRLLNPQGILVAGSCSMHLRYEDLIYVLQRAALQTHCQLQILEKGHQGPDHPIHLALPETDYLKAIFLRRIV